MENSFNGKLDRRSFIAISGAAIAGTASLGVSANANDKPLRLVPKTEANIKLPVHFYRNYPVDFDSPVPASGFLGWGSSEIDIDLRETAFVPMHIWNLGIEGCLPPWNEENAETCKAIKGTEWVKRYRSDLANMEKALAAARKAGMNICHIAGVENYASKYPQYLANKQQAGPEPQKIPGAPHGQTWYEPWQENINGPGYWKSLPQSHVMLDFAPTMKPRPDEGVCLTTHQFNHWLRQRGINNLIYIGFAINMCLWFSPCGMVDMFRLDYRSLCIEDACTTVEFKETAENMLNKQAAMWRVSSMFGYVLKLDEFSAALA